MGWVAIATRSTPRSGIRNKRGQGQFWPFSQKFPVFQDLINFSELPCKFSDDLDPEGKSREAAMYRAPRAKKRKKEGIGV